MRIIVSSRFNPFQPAREQETVSRLAGILSASGHEVEEVCLPWSDEPQALLEQLASFRLLDLTDAADRFIALDLPALFLRHPHKIVWLAGGGGGGSLGSVTAARTRQSEQREPLRPPIEQAAIRSYGESALKTALLEARSVYTADESVREELRTRLAIEAEHLPLPATSLSHPGLVNDLLEPRTASADMPPADDWQYITKRLAA